MVEWGDPVPATDALLVDLKRASGLDVYSASLAGQSEVLCFLGRSGLVKQLGIVAPRLPEGFELTSRPVHVAGHDLVLGLGELSHANALALREVLPFTAPITLGLRTSVGLGDRLGLATPGHIRALRHYPSLAPILAQQSIREMERTARTPEQVLDDATWGVFQEGWRAGYGADADHLKTTQDIAVCVRAGFVFFTFDPRDQVVDAADQDPLPVLRQRFEALPWAALGTTAALTRQTYQGKSWTLEGEPLFMDEEALLRAACKYGPSLAHLAILYRDLVGRLAGGRFEVEISVDETETPTRPEEHFFFASELKRLGLNWVSLAPRYVGAFEKGVDYIGDLALFEREFGRHAAIARALGPYKLSLHSGSDKFSIYPIAARLAKGLVHLKTAGTSYLEALRAIARMEPTFFREIYAFALAHYETDRASYHVSGRLERAPVPESLSDADLVAVLDQFDARQALHVTFGTVLTQKRPDGAPLFRDRLYRMLEQHEQEHYAALEAHLSRHLEPFAR